VRKVPKQVEFVCNVPADNVGAFEDVGTGVTPRVFVDTDDRFRPLGRNNFTGPPHGNYAGDLVGIYTRANAADLFREERIAENLEAPTFGQQAYIEDYEWDLQEKNETDD